MKGTGSLRAASKGQRIAFRRTWMTPGLTSGQLLDAGITVRQSQSRKNIKKAQRPFENYFRSEFRCSMHAPPAVGRRGILSASDAARLMTDAKASWGAPWAIRGGRGTLHTRGRRQDALETPLSAFGEDDLDKVMERLVEIRFAWDVEDGVVATSAVPESMYALTEHCEPYSREHAEKARQRRLSEEAAEDADDTESVVIDGTRINIGRIKRTRCGHPKSQFTRPKWGFTGVDTVPSVVSDAVLGPLLSSANEPMVTLRWKADNRYPVSVSEMMDLRRRVPASSIVGLPPRSAFLLLKSVATTEMEDPALDVALLIAMGEHYHGYEPTECLELLRCVRRVAVARGLSRMVVNEELISPGGLGGKGDVAQASSPRASRFPLYEDASLTQDMLGAYVREAAPFLASKVWARLPEHSQRLLRQQFYLDWIDLLALTLEVSGSTARLPGGLPNPVSRADYVSKLFFFRYTLGVDEAMMRGLVAHMAPAPVARQPLAGAAVEYVHEVGETRVRPLVLWMCAALLARVAAECLGDVLHHVGRSLQRHAELAAEEAGARGQPDAQGCQEDDPSVAAAAGLDLDGYLDRLALPRPRIVGVRPPQDRVRPRKMRIRLLPYEAFPTVFRCLPTPAQRVTRKVEAMERARRRARASPRVVVGCGGGGGNGKAGGPGASVPARVTGAPVMESPFAAVLCQSALAAKHVERATAALAWAGMIMGSCLRLVKDLPRPRHDSGGSPTASVESRPGCLPLPPAGDAEEHGSGGGARAGDVDGVDGTLEDGTVMAAREALCDRYVRAKVQALMDAIFTHIPWGEVESRIEPLLQAPRGGDAGVGAEGEGEGEAAQSPDGAAPPTEAEVNAEAELLALVLEEGAVGEQAGPPTMTAGPLRGRRGASLSTEADAGGDGGEGSRQPPPPLGGSGGSGEGLSQAERDMRAVIAQLQAGIADFHISVAELLDAHERFFGVSDDPASPVRQASSVDDS